MRSSTAALALLVHGCAATSEPRISVPAPEPEQSAPMEPLSGYVLLRPDATVRAAPEPDSEASELEPAAPVVHLLRLHAAVPARIVGKIGAYYAIATGEDPGEGAHCYRGAVLFAGFALSAFVHETDLFPVLVRPVEIRDQALGVSLDVGLAVGEPGQGNAASLHDVGADPFRLAADIPHDAIGRVYHPGRIARADIHENGELRGPCSSIDDDCAVGFGLAPIHAEILRGAISVERLADDGERALIRADGRCVSARAWVPRTAVRPLPESRALTGFGTSCGGFTGDDFEIRTGAQVTWRDGRDAGRTIGPRIWAHRHLSEPVGKRICFKRHPTQRLTCGAKGKYLSLCFDAGDVTTIATAERARGEAQ